MKSTFRELQVELDAAYEECAKQRLIILAKHGWTEEEYWTNEISNVSKQIKEDRAKEPLNVRAAYVVVRILAWFIPYALYELTRGKIVGTIRFLFRIKSAKQSAVAQPEQR